MEKVTLNINICLSPCLINFYPKKCLPPPYIAPSHTQRCSHEYLMLPYPATLYFLYIGAIKNEYMILLFLFYFYLWWNSDAPHLFFFFFLTSNIFFYFFSFCTSQSLLLKIVSLIWMSYFASLYIDQYSVVQNVLRHHVMPVTIKF